jgi:GAF domain-containing protein
MQGSTKEALLTQTFVDLVDTLVDDFDVVDLLTLVADRCVEVLDIAAAGLMLVAPEGDLRAVAFSSEAVRVVELFELQAEEGPCLDAYRSGQAIVNQDLAQLQARWPTFAPVAIDAGFRSAHAIPMRLRGAIIGALNLFRSEDGDLGEFDLIAARAMADVATIAILHHRAASEAQLVNEQLSLALNSRIAIEQAKGVMAERTGLDMEHAFARLRKYARDHNLRLIDVAHGVVDGSVKPEAMQPPGSALRS